jgi:hypothetical protein
MNLGNLYEKVQTHDSGFVSLLINENLYTVGLNETKERIQKVIAEADKYAEDNDFQYKYLELAHEPLWTDVEVKPEHFIYQGFDAYITVDLKENIADIIPYVIVQNNNVSSLKDGQTIEITDEFKNGLNELQREIFEEALLMVETKTVRTLQKVWQYEKERLGKWINTSKIALKGKK